MSGIGLPIGDSPTNIAKGFIGGAVIGAVQDALAKREEEKRRERLKNHDDVLALSNYVAMLQSDGFRLHKGYYYNIYINRNTKLSSSVITDVLATTSKKFDNTDANDKLFSFHATKVNLPGWKSKTQVGHIYGLDYETPIKYEQDPLWCSFNVDIKNSISAYFLDDLRLNMFDLGANGGYSYSPRYKDDIKFNMIIELLDENFRSTYEYIFQDCMFKTVQQMQLGHAETSISQITTEVVYETYRVLRTSDLARKAAAPNRDAYNKNQLKLGPFSTDVSAFNQQSNTLGKVPSWFSAPTKI